MYELCQILVVFAGMLAAVRVRLPLGLALLFGGVALDLWAGAGWHELGLHLGQALARADLWLLVLIMALILEMAQYMGQARNADAIVGAARRWGGRHGRAATLVLGPAAIGLVPMPGGALFSAPLVEQALPETRWPSAWKAVLNYWFRHVWEYWWPLYPVVIVSLPIFEIETWRFMATTFWFSPLAFLSGYLFLIRPRQAQLSNLPEPTGGSPRRALRLLGLLALVVLCTLFLPFAFRAWAPGMDLTVRKMTAMAVGLALALCAVARDNRRHGGAPLFRTLGERRSLSIISMMGAIILFQSLLGASGLLPAAGGALASSGIPLVVVVALLPFISGLVTGNAVGYAGTSFPLVVGMLSAADGSYTTMATLALAFGFGYAGMMLSPVHLCLVLTRDFFATSYRGMYRLLLPCVVVLLLASVGLHILFRQQGW